MNNIQEIANKFGLSFSFVDAPFNPMRPEDKGFHWACTLGMGANVFNFVFTMGGGRLQVRKSVNAMRAFGFGSGVTPRDISKIKSEIRSWYYDFDKKHFRRYSSGRLTQFEASIASACFEAEHPTLEMVMECLLQDLDILEYFGFEDWAENMGFDTDSIKARNLYESAREQSTRFKNFLGQKLLTVLIDGDEEMENNFEDSDSVEKVEKVWSKY